MPNVTAKTEKSPLVVDLTELDRERLAEAVWYLSGLVHNRFLKVPPLDFVFFF